MAMPRAWRKRLHQALVSFGLTQLQAEAEIYVAHTRETHSPDSGGIPERLERERYAAMEEPYPEKLGQAKTKKLEIFHKLHNDVALHLQKRDQK